jgi:hypothetical protein
MSARKNEINLIPQDKFAASNFGRVVTWLLSTFRVMVILVEMVVMIAFLSRFWLDAKNADLSDEIKQKAAVIKASAQLESEFNLTARKVDTFTKRTQNAFTPSKYMNSIFTYLPADVSISSTTVSSTTTSVSGSAPQETNIMQFIANLNGSKKYQRPQLTSLGINPETGKLDFILEITSI